MLILIVVRLIIQEVEIRLLLTRLHKDQPKVMLIDQVTDDQVLLTDRVIDNR